MPNPRRKRKEIQILNPNTRRQLEQIDEGTGQTYAPPAAPAPEEEEDEPKRKRRGRHQGATVY